MTHPMLAALVATAFLAPSAAHAIDTSVQLQLGAGTDFERRVVNYDCAAEAPLAVTYINAAPNFLALVPVPEETDELVFAAVISASGARYAAGQWVWWTQGPEASLYDATQGEDAAAVLTCSEIINTP